MHLGAVERGVQPVTGIRGVFKPAWTLDAGLHYAEAFFDRLPDAREWRATLQLLADSNQQWSELERVWLHLLTTLTDSEYIIVLLRED
jgi:hypothetical protein